MTSQGQCTDTLRADSLLSLFALFLLHGKQSIYTVRKGSPCRVMNKYRGVIKHFKQHTFCWTPVFVPVELFKVKFLKLTAEPLENLKRSCKKSWNLKSSKECEPWSGSRKEFGGARVGWGSTRFLSIQHCLQEIVHQKLLTEQLAIFKRKPARAEEGALNNLAGLTIMKWVYIASFCMLKKIILNINILPAIKIQFNYYTSHNKANLFNNIKLTTKNTYRNISSPFYKTWLKCL